MLNAVTFPHTDSQSRLEKCPRLSTSKTTSVKTNGRPSSACLKLEHKHDTHTHTQTKKKCVLKRRLTSSDTDGTPHESEQGKKKSYKKRGEMVEYLTNSKHEPHPLQQ